MTASVLPNLAIQTPHRFRGTVFTLRTQPVAHQQVAESPIPSGDRSTSLTRAYNPLYFTITRYSSLYDPCLALVAELCNAIQGVITPKQSPRELQLIAGLSTIC